MARTHHTADEAIARLRAAGKEENRQGMARFGIETSKALGTPMPVVREMVRAIAQDHDLAEALWASDIHEARILASLVDKPEWVTRDQMDRWAGDFNSWDVCDQVCGNLFDRTEHWRAAITDFAEDEREFVRRAAFAIVAWSTMHRKKEPDATFLTFLPLIRDHAADGRNFVKKAVNWALRQIGKRSAELHGPALALARELAASDDKTARWIGKDAAKELESEKVRARLDL